MGRATSGVQGMRFNTDDQLLSLNVVQPDTFLLVATAGGHAKRTEIEAYPVHGARGNAALTAIDECPVEGRGGKGVLTIQFDKRRGSLVGALVVDDATELYAITSG